MAMLNDCNFIGRVGKQNTIDFQKPSEGKPQLRFTLAVDQGKYQDTLWLTIICWNELAERIHEYLSKGQLVFVQGRLVLRSYLDKTQVKRVAIEIVASTVQMLEKGKKVMPDSDEGQTEETPF